MKRIKLFEAWVHSQALNEAAPHGKLDLAKLEQADGLSLSLDDPKNQFHERDNMYYERVLTTLKKNGIIFSTSPEQAAKILTSLFLKEVLENRKGFGAGATSARELQVIDDWFYSAALAQSEKVTIKLNPFPEDPAKVLTRGVITEDQIESPGDDSAGSEYEDIALYFNNAALIEIAELLWTLKNSNSGAGIKGAGYKLSIGATGVLDWVREKDKGAKFYGTTVTTSAQSKQTVTTLTWEVPDTGKTIVKKLPGTMFATGEITLSDPKELDAAIAELKALLADKSTVLGSIEIESSASGDRPAEDKKSGYPAGTKPGQYPLGKPYVVKPGETSGNAKLAFGRGETIKAKLAGLSNDIKVKAVIQDGGDKAQYAKLIVTAKKAGGASEVYTKDELNNLVLKTKQTKDLASSKTLSVWAVYTD